MNTTSQEQPSKSKLLEIFIRIAALFIIFEPIWMLLPFAGFLYGSVMHIEALSKNPYTAKLVYFVFPVHTLFPLGLLLVLSGLIIFLVGAFQIYSGKIFKKGLITNGIYRKFRHPQYLALTIFGLGIILTWGRFITYIAFFIMLWLYYFLAKSEEKKCRELFGDEYDAYRAKTFFLFPGEGLVSRVAHKLCPKKLTGGARVLLSFLLVLAFAVSSGLAIINLKTATRNTLPVITGLYRLPDHIPNNLPLLMVKGPALQAAPSEKKRTAFMEKIFEMLHSSPRITAALNDLDLTEGYTLLAFLTPGSNWYSGAHLDFRRAQINVFLFCIKTPVPYSNENFQEFRRNWQITHLIKINDMSYGRIEKGLDPAEGKITVEPYEKRMEERINFFLSGL